METEFDDILMEENNGPICRPVSIPVTEDMEEKVEWLKKVKRVNVNKYMRKQFQLLIEKAERGEFDRQKPA